MAPQRNYALEYQRRKAAGQRAGRTAYQQTHGISPGGGATSYFRGEELPLKINASYQDRKRMGRFDSLSAKLIKGQITEKEFNQRTARWAPVTDRATGEQYRFARADEVLYQAENNRQLPKRRRDRPWFDEQGS